MAVTRYRCFGDRVEGGLEVIEYEGEIGIESGREVFHTKHQGQELHVWADAFFETPSRARAEWINEQMAELESRRWELERMRTLRTVVRSVSSATASSSADASKSDKS